MLTDNGWSTCGVDDRVRADVDANQSGHHPATIKVHHCPVKRQGRDAASERMAEGSCYIRNGEAPLSVTSYHPATSVFSAVISDRGSAGFRRSDARFLAGLERAAVFERIEETLEVFGAMAGGGAEAQACLPG